MGKSLEPLNAYPMWAWCRFDHLTFPVVAILAGAIVAIALLLFSFEDQARTTGVSTTKERE